MKIIVFYKEVYGSYPTSLESEKTAAGIEDFFRMNDFVKLNREKIVSTALQLTATLIILIN